MLDAQITALNAKLVAERTGKTVIQQLQLQRAYDTQVRELLEEKATAEQEFYAAKAEALEQGLDFPFAGPDSTDIALQTAGSPRVIDLDPASKLAQCQRPQGSR